MCIYLLLVLMMDKHGRIICEKNDPSIVDDTSDALLIIKETDHTC